MEFLDTPFDSFNCFSSLSTAILPTLIQKTHEILTDGGFVCSQRFGDLLTDIEKHAYSSKELWRLIAAHALLMLSRTRCTTLINFPSYRFRLVFSLIFIRCREKRI